MERSYDIFVDNGLYILSYYLEKDVSQITYDDIHSSVDMMSDRVERFLDCEKYSNLKSMFLFNSAVSNPSLKNVKLSTHMNMFLDNVGEEYCMLCGNNHANLNISLKGRSYLPNRVSATFFNFSNNLHNLNVCPYCLVLTTYSVMNARVNRYINLYNSSEDDFMIEFTEKRQIENEQDILLKAGKSKKQSNDIDLLIEFLNYNINFDYPVEIHKFNNGRTENIPVTEQIFSENIKILRTLRNKSLLNEFMSLNLTRIITDNKLRMNYFNYIYDFDKDELKCSKELLSFLNREVNAMDENVITLIERIVNDIKESNLDPHKLRTKLKSIKSIKEFDNLLMDMQEMYLEFAGEKLFNNREYIELTHINRYIKVRNMFLTELIM